MVFSFRKGLYRWIKKDPLKAFITLSVSFVHAAFILIVSLSPLMQKQKKPQKLVVKTFQASPKSLAQEKKKAAPPKPVAAAPQKPAASQKQMTPAKVQAPKKASTETKPTAKAAAPQKPAVKQTKPATSKQAPQKKETKNSSSSVQVPKELLEELEERIAKIETKRDKIQAKSDISIPKSIDHSLANDTTYYAKEDSNIDELSTYSDFLIAYLQQTLHLPDFGEVKIEITLRQDGSIERYVVLKTENEKNRKYLEESLPSMRFPEFKGKGLSKSRQTFVLTFCNEF